MKSRLLFLVAVAFLFSNFVQAQSADSSMYTSRMYFAWGYNKEMYSRSNIEINQPSLGNHYKMMDVSGSDRIGWDNLFHNEVTIPQYNYRLGFFFKKHHNWGFEINFDHTKYQLTPGQDAHIVGQIAHRDVDTSININFNNYIWKLNNGANFFCFNMMKRYYVDGTKNGKLKLFAIFKLGTGPTWPHVENTLLGMKNSPHFQFGGWNVGIESSYRLEIGKFVYLDFSNKFDYARYWGLRVYQGTAKQSFFTYEAMLTLGIMLPFKKN